MLSKLFEEIKKNTKYFYTANDGDRFESKLKLKLKSIGFTEIVQESGTDSAIKDIAYNEGISEKDCEEIYDDIKKKILIKNSKQVFCNPFKKVKNTFIHQPYGSQQFPDFLVFLNKYIIPIEVKFSKDPKSKNKKEISKKPMWNSNLPKGNALYIYGIAYVGVTFFLGSSILDMETREKLLNFFGSFDKEYQKIDNELKNLKNNFGFYPYIRKTYDHKTKKATFINEKGEQSCESYFSKNAEKREKEVIDWLKSFETKK